MDRGCIWRELELSGSGHSTTRSVLVELARSWSAAGLGVPFWRIDEILLNQFEIRWYSQGQAFIVMVGECSVLGCSRDSSLADHPSSLFPGNLSMLAVVFIGILNWGHAVDSGSATELNALVCGTWSNRRVLLENAL